MSELTYAIMKARDGGYVITEYTTGMMGGPSVIVYAATDIELALVFLERKLTKAEK